MVVNPDEGMPDIEMYMEALASLGARHAQATGDIICSGLTVYPNGKNFMMVNASWYIYLLQVSVD